MKTITLSLTTTLSLTATIYSQSTPPWGSESFTSVADRRFTSTTTNSSFGTTNGGAGFHTSESSFSEARGSSYGYSALDNRSGLSVPLLRTYAATNGFNSSARGGSTAIEGYTYSGSSIANFSLDVSLTGSFLNMDNDFAGNFATVSIWSTDSLFGGPFPA